MELAHVDPEDFMERLVVNYTHHNSEFNFSIHWMISSTLFVLP